MQSHREVSASLFYTLYAHKIGFSVMKSASNKYGLDKWKQELIAVGDKARKCADERRDQVNFEHPVSKVNCVAQRYVKFCSI